MELSEKLEEAWVAYLQTITTWPDSMKDENDVFRILPGEDDGDKSGQCIRVIAEDCSQEDPPFSGNRWYPVRIELRTPVNEASPLGQHKDAAELLETAIQAAGVADLVNTAAYAKAAAEPADFADLDAFCLYPVISRTPIRSQEDELWMSGYALNCYCMGIKGS